MSNSNHHHDRGGHELEGIDSSTLFRVTFGLSAVTLIASILVAQWFYRQRAELAEARASADDKVLLKAHRKEMQELLNGISSTINDVHSRQLLDAQPAPPTWVHPDDVGKPAAAPAAAAPTGAAPSDPAQPAGAAATPTGSTGEAAKPTEAQPVEAKPAEAVPAEAKPAEAKPAEAKPAEAKPAEAKPAPTK